MISDPASTLILLKISLFMKLSWLLQTGELTATSIRPLLTFIGCACCASCSPTARSQASCARHSATFCPSPSSEITALSNPESATGSPSERSPGEADFREAVTDGAIELARGGQQYLVEFLQLIQ